MLASTGEQIYEGLVYGLDGRTAPLFRYERRVESSGAHVTSTHITHNPAGEVVVIQSAVHSAAYDVTRADMIHRQTGLLASVVVSDGGATFTRTDGKHETVSRERVHHPVVAGPTMFGFIVAHWDELSRGEALTIRFAVLERGETIGFVLERVASSDGRTTIRMKPSNFFVRLAVAPTHFQFDTATRHIIEYTGRVPPLEEVQGRLKALDARVEYTFRSRTFR